MDLAAATDELYAGSPEDFVERRKALAAEARAAKDRSLATAIGKLRRPTRSAWLVNLYAREEPGEVTALLELGAALQAAQSELAAAELRRLSAERQKTLAAATRRAVVLGEARGYAATEAVRLEVAQTLQAALADPDVAGDVRAGTVTEAHTYGGFGVFGAATPDGSDSVVATATTESDNTEKEAESEEEKLRADAENRLHQAETELSSAADDAEQATEQADELADRVESLRTELAEAEQAEAEARNAARAARKKVSSLEAEVRAAREAYEAI
ncbi:MAG TPA: hypothetical protein VEX66_03145 [Microlunatus sp.]|nr:hypothetical protein [Microlunatus sp.]